MIQLLFAFGSEYIFLKIEGNNVYFSNTTYGHKITTIDGLKLSKKGVEKQFPDLKDSLIWREEAIKRFKRKIKSFSSEKKIMKYLVKDLKKHGYVLKKIQEQGMRIRSVIE